MEKVKDVELEKMKNLLKIIESKMSQSIFLVKSSEFESDYYLKIPRGCTLEKQMKIWADYNLEIEKIHITKGFYLENEIHRMTKKLTKLTNYLQNNLNIIDEFQDFTFFRENLKPKIESEKTEILENRNLKNDVISVDFNFFPIEQRLGFLLTNAQSLGGQKWLEN